jgi:hypothetical protein
MKKLLVLSTILLVGCSFQRRELELQRSRLQMELNSLGDLRDQLSGEFPPGKNHVEFVLRWDLVNKILSQADGEEFPVESQRVKDVVLKVDQIRVIPEHGKPLLDARAFAIRRGVSIRLALLASIRLERADNGQPVLQVRVEEVAPAVSWRCLQLKKLTLARRFLTVKADELALNRLRFPVPSGQLFRVSVPAQDVTRRELTPRGNGSWVDLRLQRPGGSLEEVIDFVPPVFLKDGLHLFLSVR